MFVESGDGFGGGDGPSVARATEAETRGVDECGEVVGVAMGRGGGGVVDGFFADVEEFDEGPAVVNTSRRGGGGGAVGGG